ncbi:unnamed protein product [Peniophora sp. CBMAI 1063]|nr:unnamed protein product [Peniophora sp. CBMAI 1063]
MPDPTSQSNYLDIATSHIHFDWAVDFEKQSVYGSATYTLRALKDGVNEAVFDTQDLDISATSVGGKDTKFSVGKRHEVMGSALHVYLPDAASKGAEVKLTVTYATTKASTALQWLDKEQTQGKEFPYLFSQCQPIFARALAPVQDTPSLKITYSAKVASTLPVLLSALRVTPPANGPAHGGKVVGKDVVTYEYNQPVAIPSYLIAIAAGNVVYREFPKIEGRNWSCGVWAEPQLIDAAYWEFSEDTGRFLAKEEDVVGPYRFGVYDLLLLPPSFPYGGMENACLSFLTPSLLTGDRTLVDVVVHEATHSWFGNGVTHAEASHFWLNEGWTNYIERTLQSFLHGEPARGFSFVIGNAALNEALKNYSKTPKYQRLVVDFEYGEDPDDAYSSIPYEKGSNFIYYIEGLVGGLDNFLPYVRDYVETFTGKSITTWDWKAHLLGYFEKNGTAEQNAALAKIDWNAWFYGEGMELPVWPTYDESLAKGPHDLAAKWDASRVMDAKTLTFKKEDIASFNGNQNIVFLEKLASYPALPSSHISLLGPLYGFSTTQNAEIRMRFYQVALKDSTTPAARELAEPAAQWVTGLDGTGIIKGRMKFCRPVLRAVARVDHDLAHSYFAKTKESFHPIARKLIEKDLSS